MNPLKSIYKIFKKSPIVILIWAYLLIFLAGQAHPSTWTLYTQFKFGWTSFEVGLSLSFVGFAIAIAQGFLTRIIIPRLGERKSLEVGIYFYIIGFALFAYATRGWMMYAIMCLFALSGIAGPSLQSLISKDIPSSEQGELQGTLISISSLTAIFGPLLYTSLFSHFTSPAALIPFAGVAYLTASLICLFCYFLLKVFA